MPGFHADRPPRNKGLRYPADPPTVTEIVAVLQIVGDRLHGRRRRGLVAVLWRAGLRVRTLLASIKVKKGFGPTPAGGTDPGKGSLVAEQ